MCPEAAASTKRDATPLRLIFWLSYKLDPDLESFCGNSHPHLPMWLLAPLVISHLLVILAFYGISGYFTILVMLYLGANSFLLIMAYFWSSLSFVWMFLVPYDFQLLFRRFSLDFVTCEKSCDVFRYFQHFVNVLMRFWNFS